MNLYPMISLVFLSSVMLCSCTMSIILTDTHGSASDVVDQTSRVDPDIEADVDVSAAKVPEIPRV